MKKIVSLFIVGSLAASFALGADFSKKSNDEILNLAKSVKAQDQADLVIEMKKRMNEMKYKDAKDFHQQFRANLHENISKLSTQERNQRRTIVQEDMQKLTDEMSGKEIRELNLHHYNNTHSHKNHHGLRSHHANCPMR
ncbi:DUF1104 domain-containing protein [Campylobacter lari]|uniref:DUF1104 domain-containing protein n=1 Tax=Campylobacter lari TaxID=201 RepID=UPI00057EED3D|nr:DUF1104 domain-containing protein [Campylobacter lari]AJC88576.1 hypothetical protein (DUF1104 domain) [Campylobacter lari subsp. concheus LMG 11760]EAI5560199.1 DUF1104 domain-containing protein [Campylobacter lari]EAI5629605.1 DUF1104 domain-containing protein [Campylobacter lari]EAJ5701031.1 DUF1104 domain-containing protein [Campylobacter lari]EAJ5710242.1 DUF1104 domain-containing protein [Campylobacter lari]